MNWPWSIEHQPDIRMAWSPGAAVRDPRLARLQRRHARVHAGARQPDAFRRPRRTWDRLDVGLLSHWGTLEGQTHLTFGPMFGHQFSAIWIDYRGIKDEFMWPQGIDYFENSRRAVLSQRAYAIRNPLDWRGYGPNIWGITACDGPGDFLLPYLGEMREFRRYAARGVEPRPRNLRRRHHRAVRRDRLAALRAGDSRAGGARDAQAIRRSTSTASTASSTRSTRASTTTCRSTVASASAAWAG